MTLQADYTFALEPMVTYSAAHTATKADGWTVVTLDGKKAAHFEHTVAVTEDGVEVLTLRRGEKGKRRFPSQGRPLTKVTDSYKMGGA